MPRSSGTSAVKPNTSAESFAPVGINACLLCSRNFVIASVRFSSVYGMPNSMVERSPSVGKRT